MSSNRFSKITDATELVSYLKEPQRFNNVKSFSKYMKLSSVINLFSSGRLLINNPINMNDLFEYRSFTQCANWSKICFASFITQSTESMAMWSMYAQPWAEGLCISFPADGLREVVLNTEHLITVKSDKSTSWYQPDDGLISADNALSLVRVAYINGTTITCTSRDDRNTHFAKPYEIPELAGYVKDAAWDYEKEVRLRVDLPDTYNQNAVFIQLPDSLLEQISIITGPRFSGNVLTQLPQKFRPYVRIESSKFKEKLAWIPCDSCALRR